MTGSYKYLPEYDAITWVGIGLAIFSNALISISLNVQKYAHNQNELLGEARKPYTKLPIWWVGMAINAVGELGNLVAYGYAEATTVTPIGAVGVVFSVVIATFLLHEKFMPMHAAGILLIVIGVVLIVYSKGTEKVIEPTVPEFLENYFLKTQCIVYCIIVLVLTWIVFVMSKKYGEKYVILYAGLCSLIASWTVLGCKAFMAFFRLTVEKGNNQFGNCPYCFVPPLMFGMIIFCAVVSLHFLQQAMRYHDNNRVIPTYYATFTLACIIGAAVVYREFEGAAPGSIALFTLGCMIATVGVFSVSRGHEAREAPGVEMKEMNGNGHMGDSEKIGFLGADELQDTADDNWNAPSRTPSEIEEGNRRGKNTIVPKINGTVPEVHQ